MSPDQIIAVGTAVASILTALGTVLRQRQHERKVNRKVDSLTGKKG